MVEKREAFAPWSLTREAGVQSATVNGTIQVPQYIYPNLDTGFIDEKGNWKGRKSSDEEFFAFTKHLVVPNGEIVLAPATGEVDNIDMSGFKDMLVGIKTTNAGNYQLTAIMGPDTNRFYNLSPVDAANTHRMMFGYSPGGFENMANDSAEVVTADVWEIFKIQRRLGGMKNLQFKIINNSGGDADIEIAFLRLV